MKYTEALTAAIQRKRPAKAKLAQYLRSQIEESEGQDTCELQWNAIIDILSFVAPTMPKGKPKSLFAWVAKATGIKDVRGYLRHVYCDGERILASDGHRLHSAPNADGLEPGFYDPRTGHAIECNGQFPNVDRIMDTQSNAAQYPIKYTIKSDDLCVSGQTSGDSITYYSLPNGDSFNLKYMTDILSYHGECIAYQRDENAPLQMYFGDGSQAVIMPIRL